MGLDISEITFILSAISSAAVVAGAFFIVLQLRQNARLIEATLTQNRNDAAFSILERLTHEATARRRKQLHDVSESRSGGNWDGFFGSLDDFEIRSFAYQYELIGQFTREGIVDIALVTHMMSYAIVADWLAFRPIAEHLHGQFQTATNPWIHFQWLADKCREHLDSPEHLGEAPVLGA
ncbi:MAG: hypothetical protein L3K14_08850 [Thermoplasmata archaeon]|nr:hypothetical protein [Thermoplasmata archaeon]